jgi:tryptophanyl-tRNA synthetase
MPRIFSGIQPSGELHIGNWLGAVQNWVNLQQEYDCLYAIVDLHALTGVHEARGDLNQRTRDMAIGLLASGVDPEHATLFVQSHVAEHSELMWLLNSVTPVGELERMTQYKDKAAGLESIPAGLLNYPILMSADILLYRADLVPVGEDQVQHLELARGIARRWNAEYSPGEPHFPEPQPLLTKAKRIRGLDGESKMSKSKGNTIGILDSPEVIWQRLRPAVTDPARVTRKDPGTPEICALYQFHQHFSPPETVEEVAGQCRTAGWGCLDCKRVLADNMAEILAPIRAKAQELTRAPDRVDALLARGAEKARAQARETLDRARDLIGLMPSKPIAASPDT